MSSEGMGEAMAVEGATDTAAFELYIERFLAPTLRSGQIVVLDNLSVHKSERVRQLIQARGCRLLYLPSYSPDLNPIEQAFSKLKAILRRVQARTIEALQTALAYALAAITTHDARAWFRYCGYLVQS